MKTPTQEEVAALALDLEAAYTWEASGHRVMMTADLRPTHGWLSVARAASRLGAHAPAPRRKGKR
jgi:hypothetical protein